MNLNLSWLKEYLIEIEYSLIDEGYESKIDYIKESISDGEVDEIELVKIIKKYWVGVGEEGGVEEFIVDIFENVYDLDIKEINNILERYSNNI
jgi:hypothetical protein